MQQQLAGALIFLATTTSAQVVKPNFSGMWKVTGSSANVKSVMQLEQTSTTLEMRPVMDGGAVAKWIAYPIDGTETAERLGNATFFRSGHWEGTTLILESRKNLYRKGLTTREVISLSEDGRLMKTGFHVIGGDPRHDYEMTSERVPDVDPSVNATPKP
jgi:hypothetical protein